VVTASELVMVASALDTAFIVGGPMVVKEKGSLEVAGEVDVAASLVVLLAPSPLPPSPSQHLNVPSAS
jgi:hypothetical protein